MLGFSKNRGVAKLSGKFLEEFIQTQLRHAKGIYTDEELEFVHDSKVTPENLLIMEGELFDPQCRYCDEYRDNKCPGRSFDSSLDLFERTTCDKFVNHYDNETCEHCIFAKPIENDKRHIECSEKNEQRYFKKWCKKFTDKQK